MLAQFALGLVTSYDFQMLTLPLAAIFHLFLVNTIFYYLEGAVCHLCSSAAINTMLNNSPQSFFSFEKTSNLGVICKLSLI